MGLETIEYIIRPDGRVEEKVTGIKGKQVRRTHLIDRRETRHAT